MALMRSRCRYVPPGQDHNSSRAEEISKVEWLKSQRVWREHLKSEGSQIPEGVEQRERDEYQALVKAAEDSLQSLELP
jgi:hypothetical protein